jgi:hypothetical protein
MALSKYSLIRLPVGDIVVVGVDNVPTEFVVVADDDNVFTGFVAVVIIAVVVDDNKVLLFDITVGTMMPAATSIPNPTMIARMIRRSRTDLTCLFK